MEAPLAERIRPKNLSEYISQLHLVGEQGSLTHQIAKGIIPSLILWGPPGTGKTTLAQIMAEESKRPFYILSAINSGVKDIREVLEKAKNLTKDKVQLENKINPDIIGGFILQIGDMQYDASVVHQLKAIKTTLTKTNTI